jgi:hypothetical protein
MSNLAIGNYWPTILEKQPLKLSNAWNAMRRTNLWNYLTSVIHFKSRKTTCLQCQYFSSCWYMEINFAEYFWPMNREESRETIVLFISIGSKKLNKIAETRVLVQARFLHCQLHLPTVFNCEALSLVCICNKFRPN